MHDFRHAYGRRLRAAGVPLEDRQVLFDHKSKVITVHYSAPEIGMLVAAANLIGNSRRSPARTVLRVISSENRQVS